MTPVEIFLALQALTRLGQAGMDAYEQAVRNRDILLPLPHFEEPTLSQFLHSVLLSAEVRDRLRPGGDLAHLGFVEAGFDNPRLKDDDTSRRLQVEAANAIVAEQARAAGIALSAHGANLGTQAGGLIVVRQWAKSEGPPPPLARVGVALAEVALDYAAAQPSLFGAGANGDKLIAAVALNLRSLLPNPDVPGDWSNAFAEQATSIVFRASLTALSENTGALVEEEALQKLVKGVIAPLVDLAEETPGQLPKWSMLRDTLLGPVAAAAAQSVIENQAKWLGAGFDAEEAIGAITRSMLLEAAQPAGLRGLVTDAGIASVYQAVIGTIGANPALIAGSGGGIEGDLVRDLISRAADVLRDGPGAFKNITGAVLLNEAIGAFGSYLPKRIEGQSAWSTLAIDALGAVLQGAQDAAAGGAPLLDSERVQSFARLLFAQAASTPEMITGTNGNAELRRLAGALFETVATSEASLLGDALWQKVAATAIREAARNPGALIGIEGGGAAHSHGMAYLTLLLQTASDMLGESGRTPGNLLFGEALAKAAEVTLRAAAADAARLGEAAVRDAYEALLRRLIAFARAKAGAVGADRWLALFERLVGPVLRTGELPELSDDQLLDLLLKEIA